MNSRSMRQQRQERQHKQKFRTNLIWSGVGVIVFAIIGLIVWQGVKPAVGVSVPVMVSSPHLPLDSDPGQYNSNPPTSGMHYPDVARARFYNDNTYTYPPGYLVHNLEHGYVIFWYNCDLLDETGCANLKTQIKSVMDDLGGTKLIAYPWPSLDVPFAMTSWGRLEKFETFDGEKAKVFVQRNLNRSPEPNAP